MNAALVRSSCHVVGSAEPALLTGSSPVVGSGRAASLRLKPLRESGAAPYRYEREVEEFLRWSPSVRRDESGG